MKSILQLYNELKSLKFSYPNDNIGNNHEIVIALDEARNLINAGQFKKSLYTIKKVQSKLTSNKDRQFLAECHIINREYKIALNILLDLLNSDESNCHILSLCSGIFLNTGDIASAIKYNDKTLSINKNYKSACINNCFFSKNRNNKHENRLYLSNNCEISIFTSIPPNHPKLSVLPIESWHKAGFQVYSCNYKEEIQAIKQYFPRVQFVEVQRPDLFLHGKKTIRLIDIFNAIEKHGSRVSGIINSDIMLRCDNTFKSYLTNQCDDAVVYGARVDVNNLNEYNGRMYDNGFDFFFFKKDILKNIPENLFALGHPWWDYFLPLSIFTSNNKLKQLNSPVAFHQKHNINWDINSWCYYGLHMTQFFSNDIFRLINKTPQNNAHPQTLISSTAGVLGNTPRILEYHSDPIYYYDQYTCNAFSTLDVFKEQYQVQGTKVQFLE